LLTSLSDAKQNYTQASTKYEELKPQHKILQQTFLMHQLQDPTLSDSQHQAITKLMSVKKSRDSFCRIHQLKGSFKGSSICHMEIPREFGPQLISGWVNVENALCYSLQK